MRHRRTQKTSKHKKIKAVDPFYSGPRKAALYRSDKDANEEPGEQHIPRKLLEIMKQKEQLQLKNGPKKSLSSSRNKYIQNKQSASPVEFKQGKYETLAHFCRRMDKTAQEAITKAELEVQFDVQFERQGKNKLVISTKTDPDKPKESVNGEPIRTKSQKRKLKETLRRDEKRLDRYDEFTTMKDEVQFGEVVDAPPNIKAAPRKAPIVKTMAEKDLLLKQALNPGPDDTLLPRSIFDELPEVTIASVAKARQEELRTNAVQAYRQFKKQRNSKSQLPNTFD